MNMGRAYWLAHLQSRWEKMILNYCSKPPGEAAATLAEAVEQLRAVRRFCLLYLGPLSFHLAPLLDSIGTVSLPPSLHPGTCQKQEEKEEAHCVLASGNA